MLFSQTSHCIKIDILLQNVVLIYNKISVEPLSLLSPNTGSNSSRLIARVIQVRFSRCLISGKVLNGGNVFILCKITIFVCGTKLNAFLFQQAGRADAAQEQ